MVKVMYAGGAVYTGEKADAVTFKDGFNSALSQVSVSFGTATLVCSDEINGVKIEPHIVEAARVLMRCDQKVAAIKLVRAETKSGLKEAKDFCDAIPLASAISSVEFYARN